MMPKVKALDEIREQLGPPSALRWVNAPGGAVAAIARFRHRGAVVDLSGSGTFRLILQLTDSEVEADVGTGIPSRRMARVGSVITSLTLRRERIRILGEADTLHMLFSPEFGALLGARDSFHVSSRAEPALRASAVQALVGITQVESEPQLAHAVTSVARALACEKFPEHRASGGLSPQARRAVHSLLNDRVSAGVSVPELAETAGLSLHHFIKACQKTEGLTPHALLLQKRIEKAISLLADRRARVEEVAITTGFSSPSHFVSTFRRLLGVTPAAYREAAAG